MHGTEVATAGAARHTEGRPSWKRRTALKWLLIGAIAGGASVGCSSHSGNNLASEQSRSRAPANPAYGFTSDARVLDIVASSCFDCHAQQGASNWLVVMAPSYWFGESARRDLNFSEWTDYGPQRKAAEITAIGRVVTRGEMPPWDYTVFHPAAELSNEQKDLVSEWAMRESAPIAAH